VRIGAGVSLLATTFRFGVVGVLTAMVHYGLLFLGVELVQLSATVASSIGFVVAVVFNYFMHYNWTFGEPAPHGRTLWRYLVMISCGFLLNGAVMFAGVHWSALHYLLVQALALVTVVLWNFVVSNIWVFRR
jgi:putative flippase GtrA